MQYLAIMLYEETKITKTRTIQKKKFTCSFPSERTIRAPKRPPIIPPVIIITSISIGIIDIVPVIRDSEILDNWDRQIV